VPERIDASAEVAIVGAGACGLVVALRAHAAGAEVIVLERDATPSGSTAMSSGFVPAPATTFQREAGIEDDTPERFVADMMVKSKGRAVPHLAELAARNIGPALEWLAEAHGIEWSVLTDFLYPGHSRHRMHAVPEKTGTGLMARLLAACEAEGVPVVVNARAVRLFMEGDRVAAVGIERPDGAEETIACRALVLACNGFGGIAELVRRHIPEIAGGLYHGHAGNTGDALSWGQALDAASGHLSAYQGHGSLAHPHGILISWALMTRGAVQVNLRGERFSDESGGYSEQAVHVLRQPDGIAWNIYDERIHEFATDFPDYREAVAAGAVRQASNVGELARAAHLPEASLTRSLSHVEACRKGEATDGFGRSFAAFPAWEPPYYAVRVTGALFHTQGGLMTDGQTRVLRRDGSPFQNLFAGGGAACSVSGPDVSGYLSGNGLLTAIAFGFIAGESAAGGA
jgi:fumarate reductase flavoprotein subunit